MSVSVFEFINPLVFLISLAVGLLYTYITTPPPKIVIKYPTPHNAGKIKYVDDAGVCYKYVMEEVNCPLDKNDIRKMPIQQN